MAHGYADLKVIHDLDRISKLRSWREGKGSRPSPGQVQLILSDLCNHDCSFCAYRLSGYSSNQNFADEQGNSNPRRMIPTEKALEIVRDCAAIGVQGLQFTGGGEPTAHPEHLRIMREALELDLACALVTNGNLLRPGWEDVFPRFRWLRVSMDAGTAEDYARIRRVKASAWGRMLTNLESLAKADVPNLGTSFIVTKENYKGILAGAKAAQSAGAKYFRIGAFYNPDLDRYYDPSAGMRLSGKSPILREIEEMIEMAKGACPEGFVFDQFTKRVEYMRRKPTQPFCGYQHVNVYVGGDLGVYRCCEYAYNDHGLLGSLKDQSFLQWWRSHEADDKYRCFDATKCMTCPFHTKNELMEFMTRPDISETHPEFP